MTEHESDAATNLRKQLQSLQRELQTVSKDYAQALGRINELERERFHLLSMTNGADTAQIVHALNEREQYFRKQAEEWANTSRVLEQEMQTAGTVQRLLVPDTLPYDIPGVRLAASYSSASKTSGDLYGVRHDSNSQQLTLFIADVTGHGLPAALITAGVFSSIQLIEHISMGLPKLDQELMCRGVPPTELHAYANILSEPHLLLVVLDSIVTSMAHRSMAVSMFTANFETNSRLLRYANAGHCFPLLVRDGCAKSLAESDAQLGLSNDPAAQRQLYEFEIQEGDVLLVYTDGLLEANNARGQAVGMRRLARWTEALHQQPAEIVRDGICTRLDAFVGSTPIDDDVTFLVAKFQR